MPLKISLELSEATPKEVDALVCFLTVCGGGKAEETVPESAFTLKEDAPAEQKWGPSLVPAPSANPSNASETATSAGSVAPVTSNIDKSGLPWDERIHASTRTLTADGLWRKKRGIDEAAVTAVEAELRKVMAIPSPSSPVPSASMTANLAPPPPPPAAAPAPVADFQNQFVALIGRTAQALAAGKITQAQIQQCADSAGLPNIQMLFNRPDLFEQVRAAVDAIIGV